MGDVRYTQDHEYIRVEGDTGVIGITAYAQSQLGDVVYVELPESGKTLAKGDEAAVVESVKAASDIYSPVGGTVTEGNTTLEDDSARVNSDAEGAGWFFKLTITDPAELEGLMDETGYRDFVASLD